MGDIIFNIAPVTDKQWYTVLEQMRENDSAAWDRVNFEPMADVGPEGPTDNQGLREILDSNTRVFPNITAFYGNEFRIILSRPGRTQSLLDTVTIWYADQCNKLKLAKIASAVQRHIRVASTLASVGDLLGPSVREHFEARDVALSRLESLVSQATVQMEEARIRVEQELRTRERELEAKFSQDRELLVADLAAKQEVLDQRAAELEGIKKQLDDRAAMHARRQHYKDIKEKFRSWSDKFQLSPGTIRLWIGSMVFTVILMTVFGFLAGWFLYQSVHTNDQVQLGFTIAKQITFTALFVSTAFFFIRWNNNWLQRHANEEFRLKRMELDIDRASWFVEMAFEWKDQKGEGIPDALIERLTHGLFGESSNDRDVEPSESLVQALLGASRFRVRLPGDVEAEYGRGEVRRLERKEKRRKQSQEDRDNGKSDK